MSGIKQMKEESLKGMERAAAKQRVTGKERRRFVLDSYEIDDDGKFRMPGVRPNKRINSQVTPGEWKTKSRIGGC
jgi:hypothetical protein